jgi:predicted acetylornithine/succinylornithine family transaminase
MDEHVLPTYKRAPDVFVDGQGAILHDGEGREYLDFLAGIAVSALGHNHPQLTAALKDQVDKLIHTSNLYRNPYTEPVAAALAKLSGLDSVFFTNSGTEAIECSLKLARKAMRNRGEPQRIGFLALEGGFHGRTLGALSLTHAKKYREPFEPLLPGVRWLAPNDADALATALRERCFAALVLEPIQGEGGVKELALEYLRAARSLCTETGTILIHDEIQSGCGRTGKFLAAEWADVLPDLATIAKPIAAGLPMGACLVAKELAGTFQPGDHGSTFAGGPFVLRGAAVFLGLLESGLLDTVAARGQQLRDGLLALQRDFAVVTEVRGKGLILGLRLARDAETLQKKLYEKRLIANCTAGDVIRLLPPFVITKDQIERGLAVIRSCLKEL